MKNKKLSTFYFLEKILELFFRRLKIKGAMDDIVGRGGAFKPFKTLELKAPENAAKILLHCCCAPCSAAILECLLSNSITPVLYYFNPNIFPGEEYLRRRAECSKHASRLGLEQVDADVDWLAAHSAWLEKIRGFEDAPERGARCSICFQMRMDAAAEYASKNGFKVFATTLASSRWKNLEQIDAAGNAAAARYGTLFWAYNWRKGGLQQRRGELLEKYAFYNQTYCGCEFSLMENIKKK